MSSKLVSFSLLAQHSKPKDCWILIGGKVYDVSEFLDQHPGGEDVILSSTCKDATDDFNEVGHSNNAKKLMEKYLLGDIDPTTMPTKVVMAPAKQDHYHPDKLFQFYLRILQFIVPLILLGVAIYIKM